MKVKKINNRKDDHIGLAKMSQLATSHQTKSIISTTYEPMLTGHPRRQDHLFTQMGKWNFSIPLWVSSMTGGAKQARIINERLARAAEEFQLGMGLGSCRPVLEFLDRKTVRASMAKDFLLRKLVGDRPLFANLGIAQVEELVEKKQISKILTMLKFLEVDGLCLHINPLQEWLQPEGDKIKASPLEITQRLLDSFKNETPLIVKEVGQGMGPKSLAALGELPLFAVEFAALGGTNFAKLEFSRSALKEDSPMLEMTKWGHGAEEMCGWAKELLVQKKFLPNIIISGGIREFTPYFSWVKKFQSLSCSSLVGVGFPLMEKAVQGEKYLHLYLEELQSLYRMHHQYMINA
ncbi:MAG: hypothetical protein QE271_02285 [Bacteriovoracaceae bacterium]|nr:hypothetical protein [Bacteriovoracaceae bacterium]